MSRQLYPLAFAFRETQGTRIKIGGGVLLRGSATVSPKATQSFKPHALLMRADESAFRVKRVSVFDHTFETGPFEADEVMGLDPAGLPEGIELGDLIAPQTWRAKFTGDYVILPSTPIDLELETTRPYEGDFSVVLLSFVKEP